MDGHGPLSSKRKTIRKCSNCQNLFPKICYVNSKLQATDWLLCLSATLLILKPKEKTKTLCPDKRSPPWYHSHLDVFPLNQSVIQSIGRPRPPCLGYCCHLQNAGYKMQRDRNNLQVVAANPHLPCKSQVPGPSGQCLALNMGPFILPDDMHACLCKGAAGPSILPAVYTRVSWWVLSHSNGLPSSGADPSLHKPRPPHASCPCEWEELSTSFRDAECRGLPSGAEKYRSKG